MFYQEALTDELMKEVEKPSQLIVRPLSAIHKWTLDTLIKKKRKFPHILGKSEGLGAKSYMVQKNLHFLIYYEALPHI